MKPFETLYAEWVDGTLQGEDLALFERELERQGITRAEAEQDRANALELGGLLREHLAPATAPALKHPDFFNHQIMEAIRTEQPKEIPARKPMPFWRLIWGGASSIGIAAVLFVAFVLPSLNHVGPPPEYYAQILKTEAGDNDISAVAFHSNRENVTVLWLDGMDYMPQKPQKRSK